MINKKNLILFMTDKRSHIKTIDNAIKNGKLNNINLSSCVTNNLDTYKYLVNNFKIPINYIKWNKNRERSEFEKDIHDTIKNYKPDILFLTGWKFIFSKDFISNYPYILNIHAALRDSHI